MSKSFSPLLHHHIAELSEPIRESLSKAHYTPPEASNASVKSLLQSLLPQANSLPNPTTSLSEIQSEINDFTLCCAALSSSTDATSDHLSWIPHSLSVSANSAFRTLSKAFSDGLGQGVGTKIGELGLDSGLMKEEEKLVAELMGEVLPLLKERIKESSIGKGDDGDEISAAVARTPVAYAVVASYQFRWFVTQVEYPHLGKLCSLVIPCALTCLDHWSPEVKGQGMISLIHLAKNVNAAELSWYEDVILDACCQNIASSDEIWHLVVEMSVVLLTCIQRSNPRSSWFERMLGEMLSHLERQPRNKERRVAWLKHIDQLFNVMGLVLLAHFRRIFPLFFKWMHADDDETTLLVLERMHTVIKLTWIRNTPFIERGTSAICFDIFLSFFCFCFRLVDELTTLYKEAALKIAREEIRAHILQILILLQQCKGAQFEAAWDKHKDDPNLTTLKPSLSGTQATMQSTCYNGPFSPNLFPNVGWLLNDNSEESEILDATDLNFQKGSSPNRLCSSLVFNTGKTATGVLATRDHLWFLLLLSHVYALHAKRR
ncbi:hypothetical protein RHSIM_Rhsim09G0171700 [Rhododendron simsii]|uniref:ARM repeat superfamily protein n=1 Tax=Rhododendron simsii TaxID=118357 RepID=A0A834GGY2_RHOSS|nr:hypothetical protein RHSIM_Rhsim09G0171700 [Rhododendron simsii]